MDDFKLIENEIVPIYEKEGGEKLINARELHKVLCNKRQFANWIRQRIEQYGFVENKEFIRFNKFVKGDEKGYGNKKINEYFITIDMAKELSMVENNEIGKKLRKYFIEVEKRYRKIVETPTNIFDFMRLALNQIEENEKKLIKVKTIADENKKNIQDIKSKIDVVIRKDYCLASDIAEQLEIYSESNLPHSNFIGAIARQLGMKVSYKHYYEDENLAIVPDLSKGNDYYQVYYKPIAVKKITDWFNKNKIDIEYQVIYQRNSKKGVKGEVKEKGFKIDNICYKIIMKDK